MLHRCRQFAQLGNLILMDLIESDEQPGFVLGEQVCKHLNLVAQTRRDDMGLERVPCHAPGPERAERDAHTAQVAVHGAWVEIPQKSRQMLTSDPFDEPGRSGFRQDQPALRRGAILDSVQ